MILSWASPKSDTTRVGDGCYHPDMATPQPGSFPETSIYPGPYEDLNVLPKGKWNVMANGRVYVLEVLEAEATSFKATLTSGEVRNGTWDAKLNKLTFIRHIPGTVEQEWVGYLMVRDAKDPLWRIAGDLRNTRSLSQYNVPLNKGGWYATTPAD